MLEVFYRDREKSFREQMDDFEEAGFCTLCVRNLHPHEKTKECKKTLETFPNGVNWKTARL